MSITCHGYHLYRMNWHYQSKRVFGVRLLDVVSWQICLGLGLLSRGLCENLYLYYLLSRPEKELCENTAFVGLI